MRQVGTCRACGLSVDVEFSDGGPLRTEDVHTLTPLDGSPTIILHNGCDLGDDESPIIDLPASGAAGTERP